MARSQTPRLLSRFLHMMRIERGAATHTLESYKYDLQDLLAFLTTRQKRFETASTDDLRRYSRRLHTAGYAPKTGARRLSALKQFYGFLYGERIRDDNPARDLDGPRLDKPLPHYLTEDEVKTLLDAAQQDDSPKGVRLSVLLEFLYGSGLRISEALSLPTSLGQKGEASMIISGKGNKERMVPISQSAHQALARYRPHRSSFLKKGAESPWLFPAPRAKTGHMTRQNFDTDLKRLAIQTGLTQRVSAHMLRHSFATHLLHRDMDLRTVQQLLGHEDISTTTLYTHITGTREKQLLETAHPLAQLKKPTAEDAGDD